MGHMLGAQYVYSDSSGPSQSCICLHYGFEWTGSQVIKRKAYTKAHKAWSLFQALFHMLFLSQFLFLTTWVYPWTHNSQDSWHIFPKSHFLEDTDHESAWAPAKKMINIILAPLRKALPLQRKWNGVNPWSDKKRRTQGPWAFARYFRARRNGFSPKPTWSSHRNLPWLQVVSGGVQTCGHIEDLTIHVYLHTNTHLYRHI